MIFISDLEEQTKKVAEKFNNHLEEYRKNPNISVKEFNALVFAMDEAFKILQRGLDGKFSWEENANEHNI